MSLFIHFFKFFKCGMCVDLGSCYCSLVKVEVGLARGKKLYDKRADIAKKDQRRELEKEFKVKNLY